MTLGSWLRKQSKVMIERAERRPAPGLAVFHKRGSELTQDVIKNLSSTGLYLLTEERWSPGELVSLTVQKEGAPEEDPERQAEVHAKAVWRGGDGIGLSFVLPDDIDLSFWENPLNSTEDQPEPDDILREFRVAEALAFLNLLCPDATQELSQLLHFGLGNARVAGAVEIALKAERALAVRPDAGSLRAQPGLVMRILEDGSWAEDDHVRQLWAGILVSSCSCAGNDESNLALVGPLSQLTLTHVRILTAACAKATVVLSENGLLSAEPLVCPMDEIVQITGTRDISKIERDLAHLYLLGLIEKRDRSLALLPIDDANITPTSLGLELYARCNAHTGWPGDFYAIGSAAAPSTASDR